MTTNSTISPAASVRVAIDIGGTSYDVSLVRDGLVHLVNQGEIDHCPVRLPMVEMRTIGAGGGSLAGVDGVGALWVGPESAGAEPGPACYGRGGLGLAREFRLDAPTGTFAANFDRFKIPPYGLQGGLPGRPGRLWLRRAGATVEEALPSKVSGLELAAGDALRLETAGGGGHGDPAERDQRARETDRQLGYVTS